MHSKLLYKTNKFGIAGKLYYWLDEFLRDSSQSVRVNDTISKSSKFLSGVLQGSVLCPILFLIFINDMCSVSDNHKVSVKLFADDLKLFADDIKLDTSANYFSLQSN